MIYFAQAGRIGPIKIGYTSKDDVKQRLSQLQTSTHEPIYLLGVVTGEKDLEAKLHKFFSPYHVRGEWFESKPKVLMYIMGLIQGQSTEEMLKRLATIKSESDNAPEVPNGIKLADYLAEQEKYLIRAALLRTQGNVTKAARLLGMSFRALRYRLEKYPDLADERS